jgi:hypothetical protein
MSSLSARGKLIRIALRFALSVLKWVAFMAAPLRLIVSRELFVCKPRPTLAYSIYSLIDTLECGHSQEVYLFNGLHDLLNAYTETPAVTAKRHRCRPCASLLAKKKPQSVPFTAIHRVA